MPQPFGAKHGQVETSRARDFQGRRGQTIGFAGSVLFPGDLAELDEPARLESGLFVLVGQGYGSLDPAARLGEIAEGLRAGSDVAGYVRAVLTIVLRLGELLGFDERPPRRLVFEAEVERFALDHVRPDEPFGVGLACQLDGPVGGVRRQREVASLGLQVGKHHVRFRLDCGKLR